MIAAQKGSVLTKDKAEEIQGWLFKRGHFRTNWTNRYFMVDKSEVSTKGYVLVYFKKAMSLYSMSGYRNKPKGSIPLRDATMFQRARDGHPFGFSVSMQKGKTFPLRAANFDERRQWIEALELLIEMSAESNQISQVQDDDTIVESGEQNGDTTDASLKRTLRGGAAAEDKNNMSKERGTGSKETLNNPEKDNYEKAKLLFMAAKKDEVDLLFKLSAIEVDKSGNDDGDSREKKKLLISEAHHIVEQYRMASELFEDSDDLTLRKSMGCEGVEEETPKWEGVMTAMHSFIKKPKIAALFAYDAILADTEIDVGGKLKQGVVDDRHIFQDTAPPPPYTPPHASPMPRRSNVSNNDPPKNEMVPSVSEGNNSDKGRTSDISYCLDGNKVTINSRLAGSSNNAGKAEEDDDDDNDEEEEEGEDDDNDGGEYDNEGLDNVGQLLDLPDIVFEDFQQLHQDEDPNFFLPPPLPDMHLHSMNSMVEGKDGQRSNRLSHGRNSFRRSSFRRNSFSTAQYPGSSDYNPTSNHSIRLSLSDKAQHMSSWYQSQREVSVSIRQSLSAVRLTQTAGTGGVDDEDDKGGDEDNFTDYAVGDRDNNSKRSSEKGEEKNSDMFVKPSDVVASSEDLKYWAEIDQDAFENINSFNDEEANVWLTVNGFNPNDIRQPVKSPRFPVYRTTPMFEACASGELEMVKWLWDHGASEDARTSDKYGNTPFMMALCESGSILVASWLLKQLTVEGGGVSGGGGGGDNSVAAVDYSRERNNFGSTPLIVACQRGYFEVVKWLLFCTNAIVDFKQPNNSGWTPMLISCLKGHTPLIKWFVQDQNMPSKVIFARNHAGSGPILVAASQGHCGLVNYLCQVAFERFPPPTPSESNADFQSIDRVVISEKDASRGGIRDVNRALTLLEVTNKFGETALKAACKGGHIETAIILIMYGGESLCQEMHDNIEGFFPLDFTTKKTPVSQDRIPSNRENQSFSNQSVKSQLIEALRQRVTLAKFMIIQKRQQIKLSAQMKSTSPATEENTTMVMTAIKQDDVLETCSSVFYWLISPSQATVYEIVSSFIGLPNTLTQLRNMVLALKKIRSLQ